jgi:hypothetical protein
MSLKDKLEIGLKPDAPYRPDNLPDIQRDDPLCEVAGTPGDSAKVKRAREACADKPSVARAARRPAARRAPASPPRKPRTPTRRRTQ